MKSLTEEYNLGRGTLRYLLKNSRKECNEHKDCNSQMKFQHLVIEFYLTITVVVSDLTYVRVNYKWSYVCVLVDLFNREIIGYSAGVHKDAQFVQDAFATVKTDLRKIQIFHLDRVSWFKNELLEKVITTFEIK